MYHEVQSALKRLGFHPGPVDGIPGRRTIRAIRNFQRILGLRPDGVIGPDTADVLFGGAPPAALNGFAGLGTPWLAEAWRLRDVKEAPGAADNPTITGWAADLHLGSFPDSTPWCGLFVSHCVASQLPDEPLPRLPMRARSWAGFGRSCRPQPGAVAVFWRESPAAETGHVGFYFGEDDAASHILGGNQGDRVSVARIARDRLISTRWPISVPEPTGRPLKVSAAGELSRSER